MVILPQELDERHKLRFLRQCAKRTSLNAMTFADAFPLINMDCAELIMTDGSNRTNLLTVPIARSAGLARGRVGDNYSFAPQPHQRYLIIVIQNMLFMMRIKPHGDTNLIGHMASGGVVLEFFMDEAADFFAPFK